MTRFLLRDKAWEVFKIEASQSKKYVMRKHFIGKYGLCKTCASKYL